MNSPDLLTILSFLLQLLFSLLVLAAMVVVITWPRCKGKGWIIAALAIQLVVIVSNFGLSFFAELLSSSQFFDYLDYQSIVLSLQLIQFLELTVPFFLFVGFVRMRGQLIALLKLGLQSQLASANPRQPLSLEPMIANPLAQSDRRSIAPTDNDIFEVASELIESPSYTRELVIVGFGIAGLFGLLPFAMVAWAMASKDLFQLKSGKEQKDATSKTLTTTGYVLGIIGSLLGFMIIIFVAADYLPQMTR